MLQNQLGVSFQKWGLVPNSFLFEKEARDWTAFVFAVLCEKSLREELEL